LNEAEAAGFEVLVTTDKKLGYQQNLAGLELACSAKAARRSSGPMWRRWLRL